ncbi:hypothetical protein [Natrarchaeobius chitinivorans]|uniref:Uncharacterized protein n=1 Tax=Natrarchaeobius chitinivorans TaxID=1679083 RepID=A0A3N6MPD5_NATCH|nr:hypothetical protein [Natrarchaeobius chitinivorans]RQG98021.1 hypothetical protein EA473_02200 [Natrarchaeobius chitinivorans]
MRATRALAVLVLATVVGLTIAPVAGGAVASSPADTESPSNETVDSEANHTVSSFMQSSAADTANTVESGLFETKYERASDDDRATLVDDRVAELEVRLEALEAERDELSEGNETLSTGEYHARMAKLAVEIAALERSIDRTVPRAADAGVDHDRLDGLQSNATDLSASNVSMAARGLTGYHGQSPAPASNVSGGDDVTPPGHDDDATGPEQGENATVPEQDANATVPGQGENATVAEQSENASALADGE